MVGNLQDSELFESSKFTPFNHGQVVPLKVPGKEKVLANKWDWEQRVYTSGIYTGSGYIPVVYIQALFSSVCCKKTPIRLYIYENTS